MAPANASDEIKELKDMATGTTITTLDINEIAKDTKTGTLSVRMAGVRRFRFRFWLTIQLCKMASAVCPMELDVDIQE